MTRTDESAEIEYQRPGYNSIGYERVENGQYRFVRLVIDDNGGFGDNIRVALLNEGPRTMDEMFPREEFLSWLRGLTVRADSPPTD